MVFANIWEDSIFSFLELKILVLLAVLIGRDSVLLKVSEIWGLLSSAIFEDRLLLVVLLELVSWESTLSILFDVSVAFVLKIFSWAASFSVVVSSWFAYTLFFILLEIIGEVGSSWGVALPVILELLVISLDWRICSEFTAGVAFFESVDSLTFWVGAVSLSFSSGSSSADIGVDVGVGEDSS